MISQETKWIKVSIFHWTMTEANRQHRDITRTFSPKSRENQDGTNSLRNWGDLYFNFKIYYIPWEPTTFIYRGYNPYIGGWKPSFFHGFGVQGYNLTIYYILYIIYYIYIYLFRNFLFNMVVRFHKVSCSNFLFCENNNSMHVSLWWFKHKIL